MLIIKITGFGLRYWAWYKCLILKCLILFLNNVFPHNSNKNRWYLLFQPPNCFSLFWNETEARLFKSLKREINRGEERKEERSGDSESLIVHWWNIVSVFHLFYWFIFFSVYLCLVVGQTAECYKPVHFSRPSYVCKILCTTSILHLHYYLALLLRNNKGLAFHSSRVRADL